MKIKIKTEKIKKIIDSFSRLSPRKNRHDYERTFLLEVGEVCYVRFDCLELAIKQILEDVEVQQQRAFLLPTTYFGDILKTTTAEEIELESWKVADNEEKLRIKAGKSKYTLNCLDVTDYPEWVLVNAEMQHSFNVDSNSLLALLDKTISFVGVEDQNHALHGLLLHAFDDSTIINFVAADGKNMASTSIDLEINSAKTRKVILPEKGMLELKKFLGEDSKQISVYVFDSFCLFEFGQIHFVCKLIEGIYPDYQSIIPDTTVRTVVVNRIELLRALKRVAIISSFVKFNVEPEQISLFTVDHAIGEARDIVAAQLEGEAIEIAFNSDAAMEVLSSIESEKVEFAINTAIAPVLIREPNSENHKCVVSPIRTDRYTN